MEFIIIIILVVVELPVYWYTEYTSALLFSLKKIKNLRKKFYKHTNSSWFFVVEKIPFATCCMQCRI